LNPIASPQASSRVIGPGVARWCALLALALAAGCASTPLRDNGVSAAAQLVHARAGNHRLLLIGEAHGTREIPRLVTALVARYGEDGPVLLALEVSASEHEALRDYLASDGSVQARAALRRGRFWQVVGDQHDGRRNLDVLDMIERLRRMRVRGRDVALLPIDPNPEASLDSPARDRAMAQRLRAAFAAMPRGHVLALVGNVHAMLARPEDAPPQMQTPMGHWLADLDPYAVNVIARRGVFWACTPHCGPMPVAGAPAGDSRDGGEWPGIYPLLLVLPRFTIARLLGTSSSR
jgi:hypothetical protein